MPIDFTKMINYSKKMSFRDFVNKKLDGKLYAYGNMPYKCCLLEAVSVYRGMKKTDIPSELNMLDFRCLNDEFRSPKSYTKEKLNKYRAEALIPVYENYKGFLQLSNENKAKIYLYILNRYLSNKGVPKSKLINFDVFKQFKSEYFKNYELILDNIDYKNITKKYKINIGLFRKIIYIIYTVYNKLEQYNNINNIYYIIILLRSFNSNKATLKNMTKILIDARKSVKKSKPVHFKITIKS